MGFSDLPPPTTSCLKRTRSEDPSSFAELCSPPPPPKQPFHLHLSILQDLECSLNSVPAVEAASTPEELVTEMMQSLEKVLGNIEELITVPGDDLQACGISYSNCGGGISAASSPVFAAKSPQEQDLCTLGDFVVYSLPSPSDAPVNAFAGRDVPHASMARSQGSLDDSRATTSNCDAASVVEDSRCDGADGVFIETIPQSEHCEEGCVMDAYADIDSLQHVLDSAEGELGLMPSAPGTESMPVSEPNDGQWNLLDELNDEFAAASALPSNRIDWFEEGCDLPAFTLSQIEEASHAIDNPDLLLLDCYL